MSNSERDTKFAGFARLLAYDLFNTPLPGGYRSGEETCKIVAQRAYDLVRHALHSFSLYDLETCESRDELLTNIPDLTAWSEEA